MTPALPDLAYLLDCSQSRLFELELVNLDLSASCLKRAKEEMDQAIAHREAAGVARWLIDNRDEMINLAKKVADGKQGILRFTEPEPIEIPAFVTAARRIA